MVASRVNSTFICGGTTHDVGFSMCISSTGNVYSFGKHATKAHGHKRDIICVPRKISSLKCIKSISCGEYHTLCLDTEGSVFSFGLNSYGQLGIGSDELTFMTHIPQKIDLPSIKQISCGMNFSICLSNDLRLYSFGNNAYGQLGIGNNYNATSPQEIITLKDVEFVECGCNYVICNTIDDELYSWGDNSRGQRGNSNINSESLPEKCKFDLDDVVIDIKCGFNHTLLLTANQKVYSCGNNEDLQLGRVTMSKYTSTLEKMHLPKINKIQCGDFHSMFIDFRGNLFVCGRHSDRQLGLENYFQNVVYLTKHPSLSNVIDISKGGIHTFIKTSNNEIYAFGRNHFSQLGIKTEDKKQMAPIRVFEDKEDVWYSDIGNSRAKSARK